MSAIAKCSPAPRLATTFFLDKFSGLLVFKCLFSSSTRPETSGNNAEEDDSHDRGRITKTIVIFKLLFYPKLEY
jgi:hypothetical protein